MQPPRVISNNISVCPNGISRSDHQSALTEPVMHRPEGRGTEERKIGGREEAGGKKETKQKIRMERRMKNEGGREERVKEGMRKGMQ
jgi:hypothetical protein